MTRSALGDSSAHPPPGGMGTHRRRAGGLSEIAARLREPVEAHSVSTRTVGGGRVAAYIPSEKVVSTANEIFRFDQWADEVRKLEVDYCVQDDSRKWWVELAEPTQTALNMTHADCPLIIFLLVTTCNISPGAAKDCRNVGCYCIIRVNFLHKGESPMSLMAGDPKCNACCRRFACSCPSRPAFSDFACATMLPLHPWFVQAASYPGVRTSGTAPPAVSPASTRPWSWRARQP